MSTINAITSPVPAIITTVDSTGNLAFQTAGTTGLTVDTNQNSTFVGSVSAPNTFGFKNRIINGDFRIDQRNGGAALSVPPVTTLFGVDRWKYGWVSGCTFTVQQVVDAPTGFQYSTKTQITTASTANDLGFHHQTIEAANVLDLNWGTSAAQPISISFWAKSSIAGTYVGVVAYSGSSSTQYYAFTYNINVANTWTYISVQVPGCTSGGNFTGALNTQYMYVAPLSLSTTGTTTGTPNTWSSTQVGKTSSSVGLCSTLNATFNLTGVQVEKGTISTPFDYRYFGTELQMCQRYYQKSYDLTTVPATNTDVGITVGANASNPTGSNNWPDPIRFIVPMRTGPTMAFWDKAGNSNKFSYYVLGSGWSDNYGAVAAISTGQNGAIYTQGGTNGYNTAVHFTAVAEL